MDNILLIALGGVITTIIGGVVTGALAVIAAARKASQEKRADAMNEWKVISDRQEQQILRQDSVQRELQKVITELQVEHAECQAEMGEIFVWARRYYDTACQQRIILLRLGHDSEPPPPPPERRTNSSRVEFLARTSAQDATLSRHISKSVTGGPPGNLPGGPA